MNQQTQPDRAMLAAYAAKEALDQLGWSENADHTHEIFEVLKHLVEAVSQAAHTHPTGATPCQPS